FSPRDPSPLALLLFFFNCLPPAEFYTLSLHDALPILGVRTCLCYEISDRHGKIQADRAIEENVRFINKVQKQTSDMQKAMMGMQDRKSTRLNSSHVSISYAVFCLKKKKNNSTKQKRQ